MAKLFPSRIAVIEFAVIGLFVFFLTMPLDRGFPVLRLAGFGLNPSVVAVVAIACLAVVLAPASVLSLFQRKYLALQSLYFVYAALNSLRADSLVIAVVNLFRYYVTFAVIALLCIYLIENGKERAITRAIAIGVTISAGVTIVTGLFSIDIPLYQYFFLNAFVSEGVDVVQQVGRANGTMGNPLLQGTLVVLALPFLFEVKPRPLAIGLLAFALLAGTLTVSKSFLYAGALYFIAYAVIDGLKRPALLAYGSVALVATAALAITLSTSVPILGYWAQRLGVGNLGESNLSTSVGVRQSVAQVAIEEISERFTPFELLTGRGTRSAAEAIGGAHGPTSTFDNTYLTLLYEQGLLGLALFVLPFIYVLFSTRSALWIRYFWWGLAIALITGFAFNFENYTTFNCLTAAAIAYLIARKPGESLAPANIQEPNQVALA